MPFFFQFNTAGALDPNQVSSAPPSWFMGGSNFDGQMLPAGYSPFRAPMWTRQEHNCISKAAGSGAGGLPSTTTQGVYRRFPPGLHVPEGPTGALQQGQPLWIEGRVEVTSPSAARSAPQQITQPGAEHVQGAEGFYDISRGNLEERERLLLQTTPAEEQRGAVQVIKCKLCPWRYAYATSDSREKAEGPSNSWAIRTTATALSKDRTRGWSSFPGYRQQDSPR